MREVFSKKFILAFSINLVVVFSAFFLSTSSKALVPMESLVLGDLSEYYSQEKQDPLDSVFQTLEQRRDDLKGKSLEMAQEKLAYYRGFAQEGHNLKNFCSRDDFVPSVYATTYDKDQAIRSVISNLQFLGLDYTVRALAQYAKHFNFSTDQYQNLVDNMIGNYCSENISVISLAQLKKNMMARFSGDNSFILPTLEGNPLFTSKLESAVPIDDAREREMEQTLRLFKSFCSWGGLTDNLRLLPPLLKHPVVMSILIKEMSGMEIKWDRVSNTLRKEVQPDAMGVACQNLICRRVKRTEFNERMPRIVGSVSLEDDLRRLYCTEFQTANFKTEFQEPKIKEIMEGMEEQDGALLSSQLIALVTTVPDFMVRSEKFDEALAFTRFSIDQTWDKWASSEATNFSRDLYYEESLSLELVKRDLYFKKNDKKIRVLFDVNLGEFDRVNQMIGKVSTTFHLKVSKSFLRWAREQWFINTKERPEVQNEIQVRLAKMIADDIAAAREKYMTPPWSGKLEDLVAFEILEQLSLFPDNHFASTDKGFMEIPIQLNFGPFALRHMRYRHQIEQNKIRGRERMLNRELRRDERLSKTDSSNIK